MADHADIRRQELHSIMCSDWMADLSADNLADAISFWVKANPSSDHALFGGLSYPVKFLLRLEHAKRRAERGDWKPTLELGR